LPAQQLTLGMTDATVRMARKVSMTATTKMTMMTTTWKACSATPLAVSPKRCTITQLQRRKCVLFLLFILA